LEELICYSNQLTSLEGIENLVNLVNLYCSYNKLTSLEGIENLINLKELYCSYNKLTSLEGIENLINLEKIYCSHNQLTSLEGIECLTNLIKNNNTIKNNLYYDFIDSNYYLHLNLLFHCLIIYKNADETNKYIKEIENIIKELNGFQKYVLK
jgi:Leucine-rich repeat (LRR) protein